MSVGLPHTGVAIIAPPLSVQHGRATRVSPAAPVTITAAYSPSPRIVRWRDRRAGLQSSPAPIHRCHRMVCQEVRTRLHAPAVDSLVRVSRRAGGRPEHVVRHYPFLDSIDWT